MTAIMPAPIFGRSSRDAESGIASLATGTPRYSAADVNIASHSGSR